MIQPQRNRRVIIYVVLEDSICPHSLLHVLQSNMTIVGRNIRSRYPNTDLSQPHFKLGMSIFLKNWKQKKKKKSISGIFLNSLMLSASWIIIILFPSTIPPTGSISIPEQLMFSPFSFSLSSPALFVCRKLSSPLHYASSVHS